MGRRIFVLAYQKASALIEYILRSTPIKPLSHGLSFKSWNLDLIGG
jgi:hypothetical protein